MKCIKSVDLTEDCCFYVVDWSTVSIKADVLLVGLSQPYVQVCTQLQKLQLFAKTVNAENKKTSHN